jgi:hypothetical protein
MNQIVLSMFLRNDYKDKTIESYVSLPSNKICIRIICVPIFVVNYYISAEKIYREFITDSNGFVDIVG